MNITATSLPPHMSRLRPRLSILLTVMVGFGIPTIAHGQATAPAPEVMEPADPLDNMCAELGRPVSVEEIQLFSNYRISGLQSEYSEVIGRFKNSRTRSVRYLPDDNRTAQFVTIENREICLTAPGKEGKTCGVPIICNSNEADFVLVDENNAPFVSFKKAGSPTEGTTPPADDHDWVEFAGGTVRLTIEDEAIGANRVSPSNNRLAFEGGSANSCAVGAGHPLLDNAFAYSWHTNCQAASASGSGAVVYLSKAGEIGAVQMGRGAGIITRRNRLYWSFPQHHPIEMEVECQTSNDQTIPTAREEVARIITQVNVPNSVELSDPLVMRKIGEVAIEYVKDICGVSTLPRQTTFQFDGSIRGAPAEFDLTWQRDGLHVSGLPSAYLNQIAAQNRLYETTWVRRFAIYLRKKVEAERTQSLLTSMQNSEYISNISSGIRSADVQTLVALGRGLTTRMPWAERNPSFSEGRFRLSWNITSTDPSLSFFARRQEAGWQTIRSAMPSGLDHIRLNLTCLLPLSKAQRLEPDMVVDVEATLVSYNGSNQMVLNCTAP